MNDKEIAKYINTNVEFKQIEIGKFRCTHHDSQFGTQQNMTVEAQNLQQAKIKLFKKYKRFINHKEKMKHKLN